MSREDRPFATEIELSKSEQEKMFDRLIRAYGRTGAMSRRQMNSFSGLYRSFMDQRESKKTIEWLRITPYDSPTRLESLEDVPKTDIASLLQKLVVVKLNGRNPFAIGCSVPISNLEVRGDVTVLDMAVLMMKELADNHQGCAKVPFYLMNSNDAHKDVSKIAKTYDYAPVCFEQSTYPQLDLKSLNLVPLSAEATEGYGWYSPGHGDFFESFHSSGILDKLVKEGKKFLFVSNMDNLGASVDLKVLKYMHDNRVDFLMEVTKKTPADLKGGIVLQSDQKMTLFEVSQVPDKDIDKFETATRNGMLNTNSIWISLQRLKILMVAKMNKLDPIARIREANGNKVIQLETSIGTAISNFKNARVLEVPRTRYIPIKSTSDLMLVQSSLYAINSGTPVMNPERRFLTHPIVKLGPEFKNLKDYTSRFDSLPDILHLEHLIVSGDVRFGAKCVLKGTVTIAATKGDVIKIPDGAVLEDTVIQGSLNLIDI